MNESTPTPSDSFAKRAAKNLVAFGIGCIIVVAFGEAAVRLLDLPPKPLPPLNADNYRLAANPVIKFEYRPGYTPNQDQYDSSLAGFHINRSGFRDREFQREKIAETRRIIILGDSITAGNGVDNVDLTYPKRLEALFNASAEGQRTEVLNMGVGGYNTLQQVETLRVKGMTYDPDVVMIGFCVNDFSWEASPFVRLMSQLEPHQREMLGDMQWENRAWLNALISRSRLALFLFGQLQGLRGEREQSYNLEDYSISGTDPVSMALPILSDLQRAHAFECFIFIVPAFDDEFVRYGHGHIHDRLHTAAAAYPNIRLVDLFNDFESSNAHPSELAWDGLHPTAKGHELLAQFMKRYLDSPALAAGVAPKLKRSLIKNGSFEVFNSGNLTPASWYAAPQDAQDPAARVDEIAVHGTRVVALYGVEDSWSILAQQLDLVPEDFGNTLVVSAYGKAPIARNMFLEIEWRVGDERITERAPWPESPDAYTHVEVRAAIPPEADGEINRVKIAIRPGSGHGYFVDHVEARIE